jgi:anti-anti-sigma factor
MVDFNPFNTEDLELEITKHKNANLIRITKLNNIDLYNVKELDVEFKKFNSLGFEDLIIDLSKVKYIDSSGIGTIFNQAILLTEKGKKFYVLTPNSAVIHLFTIGGFSKWITILTELY